MWHEHLAVENYKEPGMLVARTIMNLSVSVPVRYKNVDSVFRMFSLTIACSPLPFHKNARAQSINKKIHPFEPSTQAKRLWIPVTAFATRGQIPATDHWKMHPEFFGGGHWNNVFVSGTVHKSNNVSKWEQFQNFEHAPRFRLINWLKRVVKNSQFAAFLLKIDLIIVFLNLLTRHKLPIAPSW